MSKRRLETKILVPVSKRCLDAPPALRPPVSGQKLLPRTDQLANLQCGFQSIKSTQKSSTFFLFFFAIVPLQEIVRGRHVFLNVIHVLIRCAFVDCKWRHLVERICFKILRSIRDLRSLLFSSSANQPQKCCNCSSAQEPKQMCLPRHGIASRALSW